VGVARALPNDPGDPNVMLAQADRALCVAKERGRNQVRPFSDWS